MSVLPKILIGAPICDQYKYCWEEYAQAVRKIDYPFYSVVFVDYSETDEWFKNLRAKGVPVVRGTWSEDERERLVNNRNIVRDIFLKGDYEYFLNLDQRVIAPKNLLRKLLRHSKRVISGLYYSKFNINGEETILPEIWKTDKRDLITFFSLEEVGGDKLLSIRSCGMGCLLIHRSILQKIEFWYDEKKEAEEGIYFCNSLRDYQTDLYCDTGAKCKHMINQSPDDSKKK
jgi:hypothetical protein